MPSPLSSTLVAGAFLLILGGAPLWVAVAFWLSAAVLEGVLFYAAGSS